MGDILTAIAGNNQTNEDFYGEIIRENLDKRILVFNDQIDENVMENYVLRILKWNKEDENLPIEARTKIKIYLDCPGGETITGMNLVDVILQSKTPVVGIVFSMAASMGYHVLLACHERIAFKNSVLLQHDGEMSLSSSSSKFKDTVKFFDSLDDRIKQYVLSRTEMTEEFYDRIYNQEYWMFADDEAKRLGVVHKIIGVDCEIEDIL